MVAEMQTNALWGQVSKDLDELVHLTNLPFIAPDTSFPIWPKFHTPQIEAYDKSKDPLDHLESFKTLLHLQSVVDEIICRAFPAMLKHPARVWFIRLMPNSINTFKKLSVQFVLHFIRGHKYKKSTACLMSIKQREDEMLRFYIIHFNKEALLTDEADDRILVATFTNGLWKGKFLFSLYKNDLKTVSNVLYQATKYMNTKNVLLA